VSTGGERGDIGDVGMVGGVGGGCDVQLDGLPALLLGFTESVDPGKGLGKTGSPFSISEARHVG
jgi:hypothetical protein